MQRDIRQRQRLEVLRREVERAGAVREIELDAHVLVAGRDVDGPMSRNVLRVKRERSSEQHGEQHGFHLESPFQKSRRWMLTSAAAKSAEEIAAAMTRPSHGIAPVWKYHAPLMKESPDHAARNAM